MSVYSVANLLSAILAGVLWGVVIIIAIFHNNRNP